MKAFLLGCITDAKGRPEPKVILGVLCVIVGIVYYIISHPKDIPGGSLLIGTGVTLIIGTTVADSRIDSTQFPPINKE